MTTVQIEGRKHYIYDGKRELVFIVKVYFDPPKYGIWTEG